MRKKVYIGFGIFFFLYSSFWFTYGLILKLPLTMTLAVLFGIFLPIGVYLDYKKEMKKRL